MARSDPYRRIAGIYDLFVEPMQSGVRRIGLRLAPPEPGWRVLDVGCGTGTGLSPYVESGCEAVGVEVSPAMLEKARARLGDRAELYLTDGSALPFEDRSFDLVTTSMVLHELSPKARPRFIREMGRVTKSEGHLLITDFQFGSLRGWRGPMSRAVSHLFERVSGHYAAYRSFKAAGGVPAVIADAGMTVQSHKIVAGGNIALYSVRSNPAAAQNQTTGQDE